MAVTARVQNNGQACIASKRFIVVRRTRRRVHRAFVEAMAEVSTGDPMDPSTVLGPLVSRAQLDLLTAQVASSVAAGAVARTGGAPLEGPRLLLPGDGADRRARRLARGVRGALRARRGRPRRRRPRRRDRARQRDALGAGRIDLGERPRRDRRRDRRARRRHGVRQRDRRPRCPSCPSVERRSRASVASSRSYGVREFTNAKTFYVA